MNYEVYWSKTAFAHLNRLWLRAANPERVMDAYDDVNRILSETPEICGESRSSTLERVWYHAPFRIAYRIDSIRQDVAVLEVSWIGY